MLILNQNSNPKASNHTAASVVPWAGWAPDLWVRPQLQLLFWTCSPSALRYEPEPASWPSARGWGCGGSTCCEPLDPVSLDKPQGSTGPCRSPAEPAGPAALGRSPPSTRQSWTPHLHLLSSSAKACGKRGALCRSESRRGQTSPADWKTRGYPALATTIQREEK